MLTEKQIVKGWKDAWQALRREPCSDMLDYYDINLASKDKAKRIAFAVNSGEYRYGPSLTIEVGKTTYLGRKIHLPGPDDAAVISEYSTCKNAHYGRSKKQIAGIHNFQQNNIYPWNVMWKHYQSHILSFSKTCNFIVITDVQNFFDSCSFEAIRRSLTNLKIDHSMVDFILYIFEGFLQRTNYRPLELRGLPQINFDLPRQVAHTMLFEVDEYLNRQTNECYARWVDDMTYGVETKERGIELIRSTEELLRNQGLRLNGAKTKILDSAEAQLYLQSSENQYLNVLTAPGKNIDSDEANDFLKRFSAFSEAEKFGHWDKVYRRYYTILGELIEKNVIPQVLSKSGKHNYENLIAKSLKDFEIIVDGRFREWVSRFWKNQIFDNMMLERVPTYFATACNQDDQLSYQMCKHLVERSTTPEVDKMAKLFIDAKSLKNVRPGHFFGAALLLSKHGSCSAIAKFARDTESFWAMNDLAARQIVALWAILPPSSDVAKYMKGLLKKKHSFVTNNLINFVENDLRDAKNLESTFRTYLPPHLKGRFFFTKSIISCNLLRSDNLASKIRIELTNGIMTFRALDCIRTKEIATNQFVRPDN